MANLQGLLSIISLAVIVCLANVPEISAKGEMSKVEFAIRDLTEKIDLSKLDVTRLTSKTSRELKNDFKVLLTDMKLRKVPLSKDRSERQLSKLYSQEKKLKEEVEKVHTNLERCTTSSGAKLDIMELKSKQEMSKNPKASKHRMSLLTQNKIDEWQREYSVKSKELEFLQNKIEHFRKIVKNKGDYISIPTNYGAFDPVEQRERERDALLRDRENMEMREGISNNVAANLNDDLPSWLIDEW